MENRRRDRTAAAFTRLALLLLVPGVLIESPSGRIFCIALAALAAGRGGRRVAAACILAACVVVGWPAWSEHRSGYDAWRAHGRQQGPGGEAPAAAAAPAKTAAQATGGP
jgi:hypothetical protein